MGTAWENNLRAIHADGPAIDLVCFTGDLAQSAQPGQYEEATAFVETLLRLLDVPSDRFFCVPGNHDVDRLVDPQAWQALRDAWGSPSLDAATLSRWLAGAGGPPFGCQPSWIDRVAERQRAYADWLAARGLMHLLPGRGGHPRLGWRHTLQRPGWPVPLNILGFDSAWLAGDDGDAGKVRLTDDQINLLACDAQGKPWPGAALGLLHHPPGELAEWQTGRTLHDRGVQILLQGHVHLTDVTQTSSPGHGMRVFTSGCLYESDTKDNTMQVLDLDLHDDGRLLPVQLWARTWHDRAREWGDGHPLTGMRNGRLRFDDQGRPASNDSPQEPATLPARFALAATRLSPVLLTRTAAGTVGRAEPLAALGAALRGADASVPRDRVIVVEGMAGIGKSKLTAKALEAHWLACTSAAEVVRIALPPMSSSLPAASPGDASSAALRDAMLSALADAFALRGGPTERRAELAARLDAQAPSTCLVWIDNVDGDLQASAAVEVVDTLQRATAGRGGLAPVVLAARRRHIGQSAGWVRVQVGRLPRAESIALLNALLTAAGIAPSAAAALDPLCQALGDLPLALRLAAGYLAGGHDAESYLALLRERELALTPADEADRLAEGVLGEDAARRTLKTSFALAWVEWQRISASPDGNAAWPAALASLAHATGGDTGAALAAAISGLQEPHAFRLLAIAARRAGLLEWIDGKGDDGQLRVDLHPLWAEFLRSALPDQAPIARARAQAWWMSQVADSADLEERRARWDGVARESASLARWLTAVEADQVHAVGRAAHAFATMHGPFGMWRDALTRWAANSTEPAVQSDLLWTLSLVAESSGALDLATRAAELMHRLDQARGADREAAMAKGKIADIFEARGQLDEALRIRREEQLPVFERLGAVREKAVTMGKIADIFQARGQLDEALRIRREEALPVYERLGDVRAKAITMGKIADIFEARGQLDEALRIRRDEELPVYERLGDVRAKAVTMGKIADIFQARGQLDEALRIRREEALPVYERLGDVRELLVARTKLAIGLALRGRGDDASEVAALLAQAHRAAVEMGLPEAAPIEELVRRIFGPSALPDAPAH